MNAKEKDKAEDKGEEEAPNFPRRRHPAGDGAGGAGCEDAQILCGRCGLRMMKTNGF